MPRFKKKPEAKRGYRLQFKKNRCQKVLICFSWTNSKPKTWLEISKMPLAITSLASGGTEPGPNRAICLGYCRNRNRDGKENQKRKTGLKEIWSRHHSYSGKLWKTINFFNIIFLKRQNGNNKREIKR